jgi:hypothetical protein
MERDAQKRHLEAADKCLVEAYSLLVKANDLLFDAGWHNPSGVKVFTADSVNSAITEVRHARHLIAKNKGE